MIFLPHIFLLMHWKRYLIYDFLRPAFHDYIIPVNALASTLLIVLYLGVLCYLHIMPCKKRQPAHPAKGYSVAEMWNIPARLKIMDGGRKIIRLCFWGILAQPFLYFFKLYHYPISYMSSSGLPQVIFDGICAFLFFYCLVLNGSIRILCTCRSLGVWKRVLFFCWVFIPLLHLFPLKYLSRRAKIEYDAECCRFENRKQRDGAMLCATRYPIIMLHGIGFRDLQYFNYWGRIPKELVRNGATVYYGHQEAWGTIENNAGIIRETIMEALKENNCEKVNIIAHSKGGLDARYLISGLHMEDHVASLTTMSTPHRGSELLNILNKLPDGIYHLIASMFDRTYHRMGDQHPDCYHASKQLSSEFCQEFNEKYPNSPKVYYQSYASIVKHTLGDNLLSVPNLLMFLAGAPKNDGLVTVESAKWGNFKKTFVSTGMRGISHGDMIDLKREDYKGFDVIEAYVEIVSELKTMGF